MRRGLNSKGYVNGSFVLGAVIATQLFATASFAADSPPQGPPDEAAQRACGAALIAGDSKVGSSYVNYLGTKVRLRGPEGGIITQNLSHLFRVQFQKLAGEKKVKEVEFKLNGVHLKTVRAPVFGILLSMRDLGAEGVGTIHKMQAELIPKSSKDKKLKLTYKFVVTKCVPVDIKEKITPKKKTKKRVSSTVTAGVFAGSSSMSAFTLWLSKQVVIKPLAGQTLGTVTSQGSPTVQERSLDLTIPAGTAPSATRFVAASGEIGTFTFVKQRKHWTIVASNLPQPSSRIEFTLGGSSSVTVTSLAACGKTKPYVAADVRGSGNSVSLIERATRVCK